MPISPYLFVFVRNYGQIPVKPFTETCFSKGADILNVELWDRSLKLRRVPSQKRKYGLMFIGNQLN